MPRARSSENGSPIAPGDRGDDDPLDIEVLSLENFDEENAKKPILTSPRSLEACRMLGIEPEELLKRPLEYFVARASRDEEPALIAKRAARYEANRQIQLKGARMQREELIDAELHGVHAGMSLRTRSFCHSPLAAKLSIGRPSESMTLQAQQHEFTVIEREKRELERIRQRQALEMQQLLNFELKMTELHRERELKEQEQRRQEERMMKEKLRRQRQADEERRRKELAKAEEQRLEGERTRREAQERQQEMVRKAEQEEKERERRRRDLQRHDQERMRREEEQRLQNELIQLRMQREAEQKAQELERREAKRQQVLEQKKRQKAQEVAEKQQRNRMRIVGVLEDRELMRRMQLEEQERKQQESQERRQHFEDERRQREEEIRLQGMKRKEMIEAVQQQLQLLEQQKRERLLEQEQEVERRLQIQEAEKQLARKEQQREERRQEEERRRVYTRMEQQLKQRQDATLSKAEQKNTIARMVQDQKKHFVRSRLQEAKLREEEIQAALLRKQKQDKYREEMLLSRIQSDNERTHLLKKQRDDLLRRRQQIKLAAMRQKQELVESFYRMKVTKKYELPKHLQASLIDRPHSTSHLLNRSLKSQEAPEESNRQRPRQLKRPASAAPRTSLWAASSSPRSARPHTSRQADLEDDDQALGVQNVDSDDEDAELEELRRKQNQELLEVLQQEHHAEEQREYLLNQVCDPTELKRMEQIFEKERAQASERIMRLTQEHEAALATPLQST